MNFVLRSTQLQTDYGCSREYQFKTGPSQAMMKDLASATSSPPAEFMVDSYLMRNCVEFPKPLYFDGHGTVCSPMDSGDSGSTNCGIPLRVKKFSFEVLLLVQISGVVSLATVNCFLVLSFHLSLFVLPQFALLPD
jgi:hypothetical protein